MNADHDAKEAARAAEDSPRRCCAFPRAPVLAGLAESIESRPSAENRTQGNAGGRRSAPPRPWRRLAQDAALGMLFGYFFLHPVSMVIFRWLDFSKPHHGGAANGDAETGGALLGPILHSFQADMIPMGLVFGFVSALLAAVIGYHRATIARQRDGLAAQLELNERYRLDLEEQARLLKERNVHLARLESAKRRTTRFMVHDFKTHLGTIIGFAGMLLERDDHGGDAQARSALERIRRQAHSMLGAVNDLLDHARLEDAGEIRREGIRVAELVAAAAADFSLPQHSGQVEIGAGPRRVPEVFGDARLLQRVLANLISNALKHNPRGTRVHLDALASDDGREAVLVCRDDGGGIPAEELPFVFEEFAAGRPGCEGSTGVGLAFCKAAVEAHGGRIWCESRPGKGSCFFFTIPINKETNNDRARAHAAGADRRG